MSLSLSTLEVDAFHFWIGEGLLQNSLEIIACNEEDAITIAKFRVLTKSAGLSLGDRACLALGKRLNLPVLTADKVWTSLSLGITITLIR